VWNLKNHILTELDGDPGPITAYGYQYYPAGNPGPLFRPRQSPLEFEHESEE
jgi:hypothetical protein